MCDMNFMPFYVNEAGRRLVGLGDLARACKTPVKEFFFPEDQQFIYEEFFPRVLKEGRAEVEIRFRHFETGEAFWMIYNVFFIRDGRGKPIGLATVSRNITDRKRAEENLHQTAEELARSNKELEQFAYVASHDLNEPLRTVSSFVQLLQQKYGNQLDADANQYIEFAVDGTKRMETLISDLLAYARVTTRSGELVPTDAGAALRQALGNLHASIQETGAEITHGDLPTVRADSSQLAQLFQNLLGNAIKFRGQAPPKFMWMPTGRETIGNSRCPTTASASTLSSRIKSSRYSAAYTPASSTQARASAWRSARKSWTGTAGHLGGIGTGTGSHLPVHAAKMTP